MTTQYKDVFCRVSNGSSFEAFQHCVREGLATYVTLEDLTGQQPTHIIPLTEIQEKRVQQYAGTGLCVTLQLTGDQAYQTRSVGEQSRLPMNTYFECINEEALSQASTRELKELRERITSVLTSRGDL